MKSVIEQIVDSINESIAEKLSAAKYTGKLIYGLTDRKTRLDITAPATVVSKQKIDHIFLDSKVPVIIYHKNTSTQYDNNERASFGRGLIQRATHRMSIVAFAMTDKSGLNQWDLEQLIQRSMPITWSSTFKKSLALKSLNTQIESCDHDAVSIYKKEWVGVNDSSVIPGAVLIELQYKIVRTYNQGCEVNCCN